METRGEETTPTEPDSPEKPEKKEEERRRTAAWMWISSGVAAVVVIVLIVLLLRDNQPAGEEPAMPMPPRTLLEAMLAARDELEWPGLDVKTAAANLATPEAAADFVRDGVAHVGYGGAWADPDAVLRTRTANAVDKARLLAALLTEMGQETRLARTIWPTGATPHEPAGPGRPAPAVEQVLSIARDHVKGLGATVTVPETKSPEAIDAAMRQEVVDSLALIEKLTKDDRPNPLFGMPLPTRVAQPLAEADWVWVQTRAPAAEGAQEQPWQDVDVVFPGRERPAEGVTAPFKPAEASATVAVQMVRDDGSARGLAEWSGPVGELVGQDISVTFLPSDGNLATLEKKRGPQDVRVWNALLRVGGVASRASAFTPAGVVMTATKDGVQVGAGSAVTLDAQGRPVIRAVPVSDMKLLEVDTRQFPRVRLMLGVSPDEPPAWHHRHFTVTEPGRSDKPLDVQLESAYAAPRPVVLVLDLSGSMNEENRLPLAKQALLALVEQLRPEQPVALVGFWHERRVYVPLAPLSQNRDQLVGRIKSITASGGTFLPEAIDAALGVAEDPAYIIFLSDGLDSRKGESGEGDYLAALPKVQERLKRSPHKFFPVGIGPADHQLMAGFAKLSGTRYHRFADAQQLPALYREIGSELAGRVVLSYDAPRSAEGDDPKRKVAIRLQGYEGTVEGDYDVPTDPRDSIARLVQVSVTLDGPGGWHWTRQRVLADLGEGFDPWQLIGAHRLGVLVAGVPARVAEARLMDELIELYYTRQVAKEGELPEKLSADRGAGWSVVTAANTLIDGLGKGTSQEVKLAWGGPAVVMVSGHLALRGEDVLRVARVDTLRQSWQPAVLTARRGRAEVGLALAAAEGRVLGGPSVNRLILDAAGALEVIHGTDEAAKAPGQPELLRRAWAAGGTVIRPTSGPAVCWAIYPDGDVQAVALGPKTPQIAANGPQVGANTSQVAANTTQVAAKGAQVEEIAAKFREIRHLLQAMGALGGGAMAAAGNPSGVVFSALCSYFDKVVAMYCYASVMLGFVGEAIESGEMDVEHAQKEAARLCEIGDPSDFAREAVRAMGEGAVRGWAGSLGASAATHYGGINPQNFGQLGGRLAAGGVRTGIGFGMNSAASSPSFAPTVTTAIAP